MLFRSIAPNPTENIVLTIATGGTPSTSPTGAANGWNIRIAPMNEIMRAGGIIAPARIASGMIPRNRITIRTFLARVDRDRGRSSGIGYSSWGWMEQKAARLDTPKKHSLGKERLPRGCSTEPFKDPPHSPLGTWYLAPFRPRSITQLAITAPFKSHDPFRPHRSLPKHQ